jgi:hypothetical protein
VRKSNPIREGLIRIKIIGPEHLGHTWVIATRLESNKTSSEGMMLTCTRAGALQTLSHR